MATVKTTYWQEVDSHRDEMQDVRDEFSARRCVDAANNRPRTPKSTYKFNLDRIAANIEKTRAALAAKECNRE